MDLIECQICKKKLKALCSHIHFAHNLGIRRYRELFPAAKTVSESSRQRYSKAMKGRIFSQETLEKMSRAKRGKIPSWYFDDEKRQAAYEKASRSSRGKEIPESTKRAVAQANRERLWTQEMRENDRKAQLKRYKKTGGMTERQRRAISEARAHQIERGEVVWQIGHYESSVAGRVYYQSSYELRFMKVLDFLKWSWKRCNKAHQWIDMKGRNHFAFPDFQVLRPTGELVYYDTKGYFSKRDQYKQMQLQKKIHLIVLTEPLLEAYERIVQ